MRLQSFFFLCQKSVDSLRLRLAMSGAHEVSKARLKYPNRDRFSSWHKPSLMTKMIDRLSYRCLQPISVDVPASRIWRPMPRVCGKFLYRIVSSGHETEGRKKHDRRKIY